MGAAADALLLLVPQAADFRRLARHLLLAAADVRGVIIVAQSP